MNGPNLPLPLVTGLSSKMWTGSSDFNFSSINSIAKFRSTECGSIPFVIDIDLVENFM